MALLPLLLFESAWKLLWLSVVALADAAADGLHAATTEVAVSCSRQEWASTAAFPVSTPARCSA